MTCRLLRTLRYHYILALFLFSAVSALNNNNNHRHVCFLNSYDSAQGPHFAALFDQLVEQTGLPSKRVALCTVQSNHALAAERRSLLQRDLDLNDCHVVVLEDYHPLTLHAKMQELDPSVVWMMDGNAFELRYKMRTSGLDRWVEQMCGPMEGSLARLYVGEGAGAICGGATMATAHVRGDDPKAAPEPQFQGIGLLGPHRSVAFGLDEQVVLQTHPKTQSEPMITALGTDQVYVWSQQQEEATSFIFLPSRKGMMEEWESPPPLPPLVDDAQGEGVQCMGEPAIDPSRAMQQTSDSEWMDG
jgi:peptidase E